LGQNVTGNFNTAIGFSALASLGASGIQYNGNLAGGAAALQSMSAGESNIGIGGSSFGTLGTATGTDAQGALGSVAIGNNAGGSMTSSGGTNVLVGHEAGYHITGGSGNIILGTWYGPSTSITNVLAMSVGVNNLLLDFNYITSNVLSLQQTTTPTGFRIYNTVDNVNGPVNYERAILDWNPTANVFTIGTQAGGTGTVRLIAIDGFQKAGAPAAGDLPSGTCALINDTSGGQTWLCYNAAGTIRKVQLT